MLRFQLAVCGLIAAFLASPACAVTKNWIDGSDNWYVDANWSPAGQPGAGDDVNIVFSDDVARTVAYAPAGSPVALGTLKLDMTGPGTNEVALANLIDTLTTASDQIGVDGRARLSQTGATHLTNSLVLGANVGAIGAYDLSITGALNVSGNSSIGLSGTGNFNQSGGTVNVTGLATPLYLGRNHGAVGNYNMTGGTLTAPIQIIGSDGEGNFTHSAGSNNATTVTIADGPTAGGAYLLSGTGQLTTNTLNVGVGGTSSFTQSGGASNSNLVQIATAVGSDGTLWVSGGVANAGNIYVGGTASNAGGIGILQVSGSNTVLNVSGGINVYQSVSNSFQFSGGTINTPAINVNGLPQRFNWTGGTLNITNDVTWGGGAATSTSAIFGSALSLSQSKILRVTGNETIGGDGVFNLNVSSGGTHSVTGNITLKAGGTVSASNTSVLNYANFTQAGGTITGTFRNVTNFVYQSGSFSGTFINDGTASFSSPFTVTNLTNNGSLTVTAGQTFSVTSTSTNTGTLTVNGGTFSGSSQFTNTGNLIVNNGTFAGSGLFTNSGNFALSGSIASSLSSFTNSAAGTLTARGTISVDLTNQGTMIVDGGLALTKNMTNTGVLQGTGTISNPGGTTNNNAGGVVNATTPGGTLSITSPFANAAGAIVNIGATSTFAPSTQGWTNSGVVNLQGAGARLAGGTITNNGVVQGFGTVATTLATSNTGTYRASGGDLVFTNSFLNSAQTTVQVLAGSSMTFLQGMTTNSGSVSIDGGTFDNTGKALSNQGTINGHGTLRTGGLNNGQGKLISVGGGDMDVFGTVTNNGVISIQNGRSAYFWNTVNGSGSFTGTGTAVFLASLSPGSSPASVSFSGGVTLGTSLAMELGGTTAGTQYDQIHVAGGLSVGGNLAVSLINGFTPAAGSTFDLLDWGTRSGTFSSISLPSLGSGLEWDMSQLYSTGAISVNSIVGGDYNNNGAVDAADFVLWRKGGPLSNEVASQGIVDDADYDAWRARFGNASGSGSGSAGGVASDLSPQVPEPAAVLVLVSAAMTMGLSRLRRCER